MTCIDELKVTEVILGERYRMRSKVLDEERAYSIYLPSSYRDEAYPTKYYPVMYVLDGDIHFNYVASVVDFMSAGANGSIQVPELIVVAIESTDRIRDFTPTSSKIDWNGDDTTMFSTSGGAQVFLDYLQVELVPHIESNYRTLPYRLLVGHSLGGLFAVHTLLTAPAFFQAYVAVDPSLWWDGHWLLKRAGVLLGNSGRPNTCLYLSLANNESIDTCRSDILKDGGRKFAALPQLTSPTSMVRFKLDYFENETHGSVPLLSLYFGLLFVFDGFKSSFAALINRPEKILAEQKKISARLDVELSLPDKFVSESGSYALAIGEDIDKVIEIFCINVANYPNSYKVYDDLAEAYRVKGEYRLMDENCEKSQHLKNKIKLLGSFLENKMSSSN